MSLPTIVIVIVVLGAILFYAGIFPGWMLIDCAISKRISNKNKILWILLIFFVWPFGSFVYGFFDSGKRYVKRISGAIILITIGFIVLFIVFLPKLKSSLHKETVQVIARLDQIEISGVPAGERDEIKADVRLVQKEMDDQWYSLSKRMVSYDLIQLFNLMSLNNRMSADDCRSWMGKFKSRTMLDQSSFHQYVEDFKRAHH
jgi:hypothetical protein